jgi:hypothetical protein
LIGNNAASLNSDVAVTGNSVYSPANDGITVVASNFTIGSNTVDSATGYGLTATTSSVKGSISGNSVTACTIDGIALNDGVSSVTISGNACTSNGGDGIQIGISGTACDENVVSGNVCRLNTGVGFREGATSTNTSLVGNNFRGNTAGDVILLATSQQSQNALDSGWPVQTYTPTLTNDTNLDGSTAQLCQFYRIGNLVTVFGGFAADVTAATTETVMQMSIPIASNFNSTNQVGGTGASSNQNTVKAIISIQADNTNDTAQFRWQNAAGTGNLAYTFQFSYLIR